MVVLTIPECSAPRSLVLVPQQGSRLVYLAVGVPKFCVDVARQVIQALFSSWFGTKLFGGAVFRKKRFAFEHCSCPGFEQFEALGGPGQANHLFVSLKPNCK